MRASASDQKTLHFAAFMAQLERRRLHARRLLVDKRAAGGRKDAFVKTGARAQLLALAVEAYLPESACSSGLPSLEA